MTDFNNDIKALLNATHSKAEQVLGLQHCDDSGYLYINVFLPHAKSVDIIAKDSQKKIASLAEIGQSGFFSKKLRRKKPFNYLLQVNQHGKTELIEDPYAYSDFSLLGELDLHLLSEGSHQQPYRVLGAHECSVNQVAGVCFSVWAPNANNVSVIGDFNHWDGRQHPMRNINHSGYWTLFIPNVPLNSTYKYEIKNKHCQLIDLKADPYAMQAQYRPDTASVIVSEHNTQWQDNAWLEAREQRNAYDAPISIYEVHLGSWRRTADNGFMNYRDIAKQLIPYVVEMGFTHLQLMPVSEYPFDGSWGYQPVGLFAPTARFGSKEDFQYFVEQCHLANIGLLIDWVPGHFPTDPHGLAQFDGTHLYEHADPKQGFHPDWNTLIYNYGRVEVANFLRASALHWLENYHVDGIRVDAVASMLYLDYSRKEGEWIPNKHGGRENLEAVDFLKRFNEELYQRFPGAFSVAEESTSWPGVSRPTSMGGLGFGFKWNMGWMNDTLEYMKRDPIHRQHHHNQMSFGLVYAFDENFILPLSHDEVVHGKGSILTRMPGDNWQKFANLRAYYGFMWAHPGKKLLFMGCEFGQGKEWNHDAELDWPLLDVSWHQGVQRLVKDLNTVYKATPALHQQDCQASGFTWLDHENATQSIYSFIRFPHDRSTPVVVICNFTPQCHQHFNIGVPVAGHYKELINSDAEIYGGSNQGNATGVNSSELPWQGQPHSINVTVPPLSTVIFALSDGQAL
jgi:1,4-alpha-glucan branching enzyme